MDNYLIELSKSSDNFEEIKKDILDQYEAIYKALAIELPHQKTPAHKTPEHFKEAVGGLSEIQKAILSIHLFTYIKDEKITKLVSENFFLKVYDYGLHYKYYADIEDALGEFNYPLDVNKCLQARYGLSYKLNPKLDTAYSLHLLISHDVPCYGYFMWKEKGSDEFYESVSANVIESHEVYLFKIGREKAMESYIEAINARDHYHQS